MRTLLAVVPALLALLSLTACGEPTRFVAPSLAVGVADPTRVAFQVVDSAGVPVEGAAVFLAPPPRQPPTIGALTDGAGWARLTGVDALPAGRYTVVIRRLGYLPVSRPLVLPHTAAGSRVVRLEPAPSAIICTLQVFAP